MYLLVDAQLPIRLAEWLRAKGLTAAHIDEVGLTGADDHRIWLYAAQISELPSIIVTKDDDFIFIQGTRADDVRIIWVRLGNCSNRQLIEAFERTLPSLLSGLLSGTRIIEIIP